MSKKKEQDKFHAYSINTDDAWEIDDRTMNLKILEDDERASKTSLNPSDGKEHIRSLDAARRFDSFQFVNQQMHRTVLDALTTIWLPEHRSLLEIPIAAAHEPI